MKSSPGNSSFNFSRICGSEVLLMYGEPRSRESTLLWSQFMHYTFEMHWKYSTLLSLSVLLSPFVPWADECAEQLNLNFNFLKTSSSKSSGQSQGSMRILFSVWHILSSYYSRSISDPLCCCACNWRWTELAPLCSLPSFTSSFRRSFVTSRPRWRSTAITRSSWSCPTRSCGTWRLWETRSTSRGTRTSTTHSLRRPGRWATR